MQAVPGGFVRAAPRLCGKAPDFPVGPVQIRHDSFAVDQIRGLREAIESRVEDFLLAFDFVDQPRVHQLVGHQTRGAGCDGMRIIDRDEGGRGQQNDDGREADHEYA